MVDERLIDQIVAAVMAEISGETSLTTAPQKAETPTPPGHPDITTQEAKSTPGLENPQDPLALARMMGKTSARIGVGRTGPRLRTRTLLTLRADHAVARDAVFQDVDGGILESLGLFSVQSCCESRTQHLTRPDLGRTLAPEATEKLKSSCTQNPDVQIFASDGLSSRAIEANLPKLLPILTEELKARGLAVGTPFFVKFGRVAVMEQVAQVLGCGKVVCVLIGERPGLGSAESMSAYLAYAPTPGMPESERTVVSNIYQNGISAAEAGAYISEVVGLMLEQKAAGVNLKKA